MRSVLLFEKLLGLVEMTSGLASVSFSLPEWQAVKMIFFAPCTRPTMRYKLQNLVYTQDRVAAHAFVHYLYPTQSGSIKDCNFTYSSIKYDFVLS